MTTPSLETRVKVLTAERDEYQKAAVRTAVNCKFEYDKLLASRDACRAAAINTAANYEAENDKLLAERDALRLANKDLTSWFDALKADHDALIAAGQSPQKPDLSAA